MLDRGSAGRVAWQGLNRCYVARASRGLSTGFPVRRRLVSVRAPAREARHFPASALLFSLSAAPSIAELPKREGGERDRQKERAVRALPSTESVCCSLHSLHSAMCSTECNNSCFVGGSTGLVGFPGRPAACVSTLSRLEPALSALARGSGRAARPPTSIPCAAGGCHWLAAASRTLQDACVGADRWMWCADGRTERASDLQSFIPRRAADGGVPWPGLPTPAWRPLRPAAPLPGPPAVRGRTAAK